MKKIALVFLIMTSFGCSHLSSLSTTSAPKNRDNPVKAEASKTIFLLLNFDNSFVDQVTKSLAEQCPNGVVKGILTKHERVTYFPILLHREKITSEGYCVGQRTASNRVKTRKRIRGKKRPKGTLKNRRKNLRGVSSQEDSEGAQAEGLPVELQNAE